MDTGPAVQGREIDIYMWNCGEAVDFGRRSIAINVLRLGWNPKASAPASIAEIRAHEAATPEATAAQASTTSVTVVVTSPPAASDASAAVLESTPK